MTPILAHISPFDVVAGARIDVRVASSLEAEAHGLNGLAWAAALVDRPQLSIEIMSIDLSGRVQVGRARFSIALANAGISADRVLKWGGAPVKIYSAKALAWPALTEFDGEITDHTFDLDTGLLTVTAEVSTSLIEKPLLTLEFDGSGGIGGEAEKRGTLKPAGFGSCENIPPIWFDTTRNIGMIDGYGNTTAITRLMEGASDMGASVGNYASYAALAAAIDADAIPPGRWGTCIAEGLIGLGAPPVGIIGVNATFGSNRLGAIMNRILQTHAGVSAGDIDTASFTALDAALNYPAHHWTDSQVECKSLLETMARSCNSTLVITFQRKIAISRATASAPVATLDRSGQQIPRCIDWRILSPQRPIWRLKSRAARPAQVLTLDQVNYVDTIIDRGLYNAGTVYRAGNVAWLADKSSWLYINATANSGNAPPTWPTTSNAYWQVLTPPATAANVSYADGTSLEALKPEEGGSNKTETRTAAAIAGQAWAATNGAQSVVSNAYAAFGAGQNRVRFSMFEKGNTGWGVRFNPSGLSITQTAFTNNGIRIGKIEWGYGAAGQTVSLGTTTGERYRIPVKPGEYIYCSVALRGLGPLSAAYPALIWTNSADAFVSGWALPTNTGELTGGILNRWEGFVQVPAGVYFAYLEVYATSSGSGVASLEISQPMIVGAIAGQVAFPAFSPGPGAEYGGDITGENTAAAISGQGDLATTNRSTLAFGANAIVNSDFLRGGYGWFFSAFATDGGINLPSWFGMRNVLWFRKSGALASGDTIDCSQTGWWGTANANSQNNFGVPVKQGDRVYIRSLLGQHRCVAQLYLLVYDKDFNLLEAPWWSGALEGGGANGNPANFNLVGGLHTISNAAAASMQFMIRMLGTGDTDPYIFLTEPAMGIVPAGQTVLPPYLPGRQDPVADQTGANQVTVVQPSDQIIYRDWQGTPKAGQFPRTLTPAVSRGSTDIRTSSETTYSISNTGTISASINNTGGSADKGRITLSSGLGTINLTVTVGGIAYGPFPIRVTSQDDIPPIDQGAAGGSDSTLSDVSGTSFIQITSNDSGETLFTVSTTSNTQSIIGTAPLIYQYTSLITRGRALVARWEYRLQGDTVWIAFGSDITGSTSYWDADGLYGEPGEITVNQSVVPGSVGTWEVRLVAAQNLGGAGNIQIYDGTATISRS